MSNSMATTTPFQDHKNQLCYVQCSFCNTILLVSVPCKNLMVSVVTVRCGHCQGLLSVDFETEPSFVPLHFLASLHRDNFTLIEKEDIPTSAAVVVNKPPEKRRRAPSAYNCFIKEEIKRIKAEHPSVTHKEAFSTAAKNVHKYT
ncbi:crabs claw [Zostera marina]|uniref:Crabs claw n=1 Tax=Zostera marina TaxID=29655 RepID=A0A0K9PNH1_ZOSMR|nr:crabs claw [Zostera marina]